MNKRCFFGKFVKVKPEDDYHLNAYPCDEVRLLQDYWKKEWRRVNKTDEVKFVDKIYVRYLQDIEEFLSKCKCNEKEID